MTTRALREATSDDARAVWEINNHPTVRAQSLSTDAIAWESHVAWFTRRLKSSDCLFFVMTEDDRVVAVVRFDRGDGGAVISVAVDPREHGRGLGTEAITLATAELRSRWPGREAIAFVRADNMASRRAFVRAGYDLRDTTKRDGFMLERYIAPA